LLSVAVLGCVALSVPSATAAPQLTIAEVERQVARLQSQAEQASEQYNTTKEQLASINVRLRAAGKQLARQRAEVMLARRQVGELAAETYRRGELSTLNLVLSNNPEALLAQAGYLPALGDSQSGAMTRLQAGETKLVETQSEIKDQQSKAEMAEIRLQLNRNTVYQKLAQATADLGKLKAAQRAALARSQQKQESAGVPAGGGTAVCHGMAVAAPSRAARTAITFACAQLGKPYVWAGAGPSTWDCSGLTMRAYQAAGISLPHSAAMQATYGNRVSLSSLLPGDLLFFHSPISHVAIYLGHGLMLHAPHTGDVVRIASVYETPAAAVRF
jgi:cell wall-associated NlpC family hydrolase